MESSDSPSMCLLILTIFSPGQVEPPTPSAAKPQLSLLLVKPSVFPAQDLFLPYVRIMHSIYIFHLEETWDDETGGG